MQPKPLYQEGQTIGGTPYRVVRFLGGGGMGSVYEVEDTTIGKHYVVKMLHGELAHRGDLIKMLQQEARLLARVKHKNIVDVITAGKTSDAHGLPFIVMEKLDGITLKGLMQAHRLPWQFVRQIANELLEALYRMHHPAEGLPMIHRDIKPENIFLAKDDDGKYITKLLDLGIASWLDGQKHQGFHGTLKYAAPEQLRLEPLSERTDLYQAALVFFEMLTGRHPFADAKDADAMIDAALVRTPPRVTELVDVPRRVDDVIDAALSKNPSKRPRDAYVFMTALQELREQVAPRVADLANTTMEDLHTAIAKQTETGYEAYATADGSTIEGMSEPPFESSTLQDAFPSFAIASTEAPPVKRVSTVPLARPVQAQSPSNPPVRAASSDVDREAATRSLRETPPRRAAHNDTEELLDGLMPPELAAIREKARKERAEKLPWGREVSPAATSRSDEADSRAVADGVTSFSEPSTATPIAAGVPLRPLGFGASRGTWLWGAIAVALAVALGASALRGREAATSRETNAPTNAVPSASAAQLSPSTHVAPRAVAETIAPSAEVTHAASPPALGVTAEPAPAAAPKRSAPTPAVTAPHATRPAAARVPHAPTPLTTVRRAPSPTAAPSPAAAPAKTADKAPVMPSPPPPPVFNDAGMIRSL